jgi:predicted signal transduction protein with EAL and GGDEF domain
LVTRLGGDEFGILVDGPDELERALSVARRLLAALHRPLDLDGYEIELGASVGIALAPAHATDVAGVLRRADLAMYRAKASGKGRHTVFEPAMHAALLDRVELEAELRDAGFELSGVLAVEGVGEFAQDIEVWLDDPVRRGVLLRAIARVEAEPTLIGASPHLLALATRA